jgi:hypothetical protein
MKEPSSPSAGGVVRNSTMEAVVAGVILIIGLVTLVESWRLGARWTDEGPGAGYFPFYIAVVLSLASGGILVKALRSRRSDGSAFVDALQLRRVLQVLLPAVLYVLAVQVVGIYAASTVYIALFMVLLGKYSWVRSIMVGVSINVLFFLMFEVWFKVPLFKGMLDPTRLLGY